MHKFGVVALMGPPNAGKSTLMNAYLGQKVAIVSPKPQTTRNRISGILTRDDAQIVFLDTPGVHRLRGKLNRFLLESAWQALSGADVAVALLDGAHYAAKPGAMEADVKPLVEPLKGYGGPVIVGVNKVDAVKDKSRLLPVMEAAGRFFPGAEIVPMSALSGDGREMLLERVLSHLHEGPALYPEDQISTAPVRFLTAEIVREKLFLELRQELPYSTAVEIEHWEEEGDRVRINAVIYVARDTHKSMVIGKGGAMLKKVGTEARAEIEELLGQRAHLELWVKVREDWTEDPGFLRALGLGE
ncbi:GTPase Era [Desulfovibrio aminophilus]|uniref:GTPase Era n=1 Tax=Desulfovibrio aminophilus TaxID=81425 RepID=UPI003392E6BF